MIMRLNESAICAVLTHDQWKEFACGEIYYRNPEFLIDGRWYDIRISRVNMMVDILTKQPVHVRDLGMATQWREAEDV